MSGPPRHARHGHRRQRGFTLLEALVGITIFSLVVVALYAGFRLGVRSWESGERAHTTTSELRLASGFIRRQLSQAFPLAVSTGSAWRLWFEGSAERLVFISEMPAHLGQGGMYELTMSVDRGEDGERLMVSRRLLHPDVESGVAGAEDETRPLLEELDSVRFDFYGSPRRDVEPTWQSSWDDAQRLPSLVRVRLASRAAGQWPEMLIRLHTDGVRYQRTSAAGGRELGNSPPGQPPSSSKGGVAPGVFQ
jgi:general secretion pathway protein J